MSRMMTGDAVAPPQTLNPRAVVRLKAVSAEAGISLSTLRRLTASGRGPRLLRLSERCLGVRRADLDAWLDGRRV